MAKKRYRIWKVVVSWILGSIFAMLATWMTSFAVVELQPVSYLFLFLAFFFFLLTGIFWIAVAVAIKESK
jgi:hypothetical protein